MCQNVLEIFDVNGIDTKICIKTMTDSVLEDSQIMEGFMVSDVNGKNTIHLPKLYSRQSLPIDKSEVPTADKVKLASSSAYRR